MQRRVMLLKNLTDAYRDKAVKGAIAQQSSTAYAFTAWAGRGSLVLCSILSVFGSRGRSELQHAGMEAGEFRLPARVVCGD
jgi:hypothetical protein